MTDLNAFARRLRLADVQLAKDFLKAESVAGEIVAAEVRKNADFSTKIPGSVGVRRRGTRVRIQAGGTKAPDAAPLENHGNPGTFRHPVFGNFDVWVSQPARPSLTKAAHDKIDEFEQAVLVEVIEFERRL